MKSFALLGLAFAMSPTLVAAQQSPNPDAAALPRPNLQQMQQMHEQMQQLHLKERVALLSALTPAHRALLASVVGQLAIAPNPDRAAAARALDAALSPGEARSVLATKAAAETQARSLMEAARTQFEASLSPDQRAQMQSEMQQRLSARAGQPGQTLRPDMTPDAGRTLLELGDGGEHHDFHMVGGPPGPPPAQ